MKFKTKEKTVEAKELKQGEFYKMMEWVGVKGQWLGRACIRIGGIDGFIPRVGDFVIKERGVFSKMSGDDFRQAFQAF